MIEAFRYPSEAPSLEECGVGPQPVPPFATTTSAASANSTRTSRCCASECEGNCGKECCENNKARLLGGVLRQLDGVMETAREWLAQHGHIRDTAQTKQ
jgi:hypothetical protein